MEKQTLACKLKSCTKWNTHWLLFRLQYCTLRRSRTWAPDSLVVCRWVFFHLFLICLNPIRRHAQKVVVKLLRLNKNIFRVIFVLTTNIFLTNTRSQTAGRAKIIQHGGNPINPKWAPSKGSRVYTFKKKNDFLYWTTSTFLCLFRKEYLFHNKVCRTIPARLVIRKSQTNTLLIC